MNWSGFQLDKSPVVLHNQIHPLVIYFGLSKSEFPLIQDLKSLSNSTLRGCLKETWFALMTGMMEGPT